VIRRNSCVKIQNLRTMLEVGFVVKIFLSIQCNKNSDSKIQFTSRPQAQRTVETDWTLGEAKRYETVL
jgi:hypothetical protein